MWYRIGDSVPTRSIGKNNSTLIIPAVTPYDAGVYYCIAEKEEITVESNKAELSVDGRGLKSLIITIVYNLCRSTECQYHAN